jgi:hypothetical protein
MQIAGFAERGFNQKIKMNLEEEGNLPIYQFFSIQVIELHFSSLFFY